MNLNTMKLSIPSLLLMTLWSLTGFTFEYMPISASNVSENELLLPPDNDEACNATQLLCGESITGSTIEATDADGLIGTFCSGVPITSPGVWYIYTPVQQNQVILNTCSSGDVDTKIHIYESMGDCSSLACLSAADDQCGLNAQIAFQSEVGTDYYILVSEGDTAEGIDFTIELSCIDCEAPANDGWENPEILENNLPVVGSLCCSTESDAPNPIGEGIPTYDVFFVFNSGEYDYIDFNLTNISGSDVGLIIYSGSINDGLFLNVEPELYCLVSETCAGTLQDFMSTNPNTDYSAVVFTTDPVVCGDFSLTIVGNNLGCTDPAADNYDATATVFDGSCNYSSVPPNNTCPEAIEISCNSVTEGSTGGATLGGWTVTSSCSQLPGIGVWYTLFPEEGVVTLSTCGSDIDSKIHVWTSVDCAGEFDCVEQIDGTFATESSDLGSCGFENQDDASVSFIADGFTQYTIYIVAEGPNINEEYDYNGPFTLQSTCVPISEGCMNPVAYNYNEEATIEDGSCDFFSETCQGEEGTPLQINMYDTIGDGWDSGAYTLVNDMGEVVYSNTINTAQYGESANGYLSNIFGFDLICLQDGCYTITVEGSVYAFSNAINIVDEFGTSIAAFGTPEGGNNEGDFSIDFSVGDLICGCTDPAACNYNAEATNSNGTCEMPLYYIPADFSTSTSEPMILVCEGSEPTNYYLADQDCAAAVAGTNPDCLSVDWDATCSGIYNCCTNEELGCLDSSACNFNPNACTGGDCYFLVGCIDPNANNFDPLAECNDGCTYSFNGIVFNDLNSNGIQDESELGLANEVVTVNEGDILLITDINGQFQFEAATGSFSFQGTPTVAFPTITTGGPQTFSTQDYTGEPIVIGKSFENEVYEMEIYLYSENGNTINCDQENTFYISYRNMSNVETSGEVVFSVDALIPEAIPITPADLIEDGMYHYNFENLQPNETRIAQITLIGPSFELEGTALEFSAEVMGFNNDILVATGSQTTTHTVVCSYDPNDKQAFPLGYEEPHFVNPNDEIEYLIRFQNTGTLQATDVIVTDTISEFLDISSFELLAHSHNVQAVINTETRVIEFYFENINLPDSNCCEPESHGFFSYQIRPLDDLEHNTRIENTAYIFFDANPAVITNTTWNTIFICDDAFATFTLPAAEVCMSEDVYFSHGEPYFEEYNWFINDEVLGSTSDFSTTFEEVGTYDVMLIIENPLCIASQSTSIDVVENPEVVVTGNQAICLGEEVTLLVSGAESYIWEGEGEGDSITVSPDENTTYNVTGVNQNDCASIASFDVTVYPLPEASFSQTENILTALEGEAWQWFLNGELIDGATEQELQIFEDGNYSVEITNADGCVDVSDEIFLVYVGIDSFTDESVKLFPVPVDGNGILNIGGINPNDLSNLEILDASGRKVWNSAKGVSKIAFEGLPSGTYVFTASYNKETIKVQFVVK